MTYRDVINIILPPQNNGSAHITGHYGEQRSSGPHGGSDFNYEGGQSGVNLEHPTLHSPVDGDVTFVGGQYGTIKIRDADGNSHEILHTQTQTVTVGQQLSQGDAIGTMGGRGPNGDAQYAQHAHYQMKDRDGQPINPEAYWDAQPTRSSSSTSATPVESWCYPFQTSAHTEATHPQTFYSAFSQMDDGFYPLGVNGFPHGGVHFGIATAHAFDQSSGVRCLADGDIVAYRINDQYLKLHFTQDGHWAMYSTGFVLVRHTLTLPPDPDNPAAASETQTFFSLYMHLADWTTYLADSALKPPGWWIGVEAFRIGHADQQSGGGVKGARVRTEPTAGARGRYRAGQLAGFLPEGSVVRVGEKRGPWGHITAITAGGMVSADSGGTFGGDDDLNGPWHRPEGASSRAPVTPAGDWGWIYLHEQHAVTEPSDLGGVVIPAQPIPVKAGTLLGHLGQYLDHESTSGLPPRPIRPLLHLEVFAGDEFKAFLDTSRALAARLPVDQKTVLVVNVGVRLAPEPANPDRKLASPTRQFVRAKPEPDSPTEGRWVKVQPYHREIVAGIPWERKDGAPVWIERERLAQASADTLAWSRFPLEHADTGPANGLAITYPRAALDALDGRDRATDDQGHHWWRIECGTDDHRTVRGWVSDQHPDTTWESPWAWPGFELVDATDLALTDAFQRNLVVTGSAEGSEARGFQDAKDRADASAFLQRLAQTLSHYVQRDARGQPINRRDTVNARVMQEAMRVPWLAHDLSHLVLRYESEWGGNMERWEAITPLFRNARENWQCELERVRKLQWWDEVRGKIEGFPESAVVYHIHPVALVGNFLRRRAQGSSLFPSEVIDAAQASQDRWGIPASVTLAQWAFESGFGRHMPPNSNNPFGIKASKQDLADGTYVDAMTTEVIKGERVHVSQPFKKFSSLRDAFDQHGRLLASHPAYAQARQGLPDPYAFANGLTGHYATEPDYGKKLINGYIKPNNLVQYDSDR